jgi:transcriptional regulator with XRE-family HTH domain
MADFADEVRRLMADRGLSLRGLARAAGYDPSHLSKILGRRKPPSPYLAARLDDVLGADGEIIAAASVAAAAGDAARLPLRELADHAAELGQWAETGNAGPGTIATLDEEIARVIREYSASPPGPLILRASDACRRVSVLLRQHQRLRHARDLYVVGARCCAFLSAALGDLGQQAEAGAYARTALTLAEEAADAGAVALALSALSKVAFWDGRRQHAADVAAHGYQLARTSDAVRVLLACQEADASPIPRAREAITLAARARDEADGDDPGLFSCGRVRLACYTATLRLREGDSAGVQAAAADAAAAVRYGEEAPFGSWAQVQITSALALLASGDAEQAAGRLGPVLDLPPEMRLATFASKIAQAGSLASAAPYRGSQAARTLAEEVRGYLGQAASGTMPYPLALGPGAEE